MRSGTLSAVNSAGPSSPRAAAEGSDSVAASAAASSPQLTTAVSTRGGSIDSSRGRSSHSHGHQSSGDKGDKGRRPSSITSTSTGDYAAPDSYLTPGYSGLPASFYGLDAHSAEDLSSFTTTEPTFFDYSVSPPYIGSDVGGGDTAGSVGVGASSAAAGVGMRSTSQPQQHEAALYYGHVQGLVTTCPSCMSGMGCVVHGAGF